MTSDDYGDESPDSGPYCRHWVVYDDPDGCHVRCANCGHCCMAEGNEHTAECMVKGCGCTEWKEPGER